MQEKKCQNCLCYKKDDGYCQVNIIIHDKKFKMPVFESDNCHFLDIGVDINQVRLWEESTDDGKCIKIEYPDDFFGSGNKTQSEQKR